MERNSRIRVRVRVPHVPREPVLLVPENRVGGDPRGREVGGASLVLRLRPRVAHHDVSETASLRLQRRVVVEVLYEFGQPRPPPPGRLVDVGLARGYQVTDQRVLTRRLSPFERSRGARGCTEKLDDDGRQLARFHPSPRVLVAVQRTLVDVLVRVPVVFRGEPNLGERGVDL